MKFKNEIYLKIKIKMKYIYSFFLIILYKL